MKILLVADEPCKSLWDYYDESKLKGYDLILSAGDLPPSYLSFLVTFSNCPLIYVHGNHDDIYDTKPPEGCISAEDKIIVRNGIRILGLGGSMRYNNGIHQCTESAMARRIRRLRLQLAMYGGFDILLTHAPLHGFGDQDDLPHRGFECFKALLSTYNPDYMIHGHVHMSYGYNIPRQTQYGNTQIINAFERFTLEYEPAVKEAGKKTEGGGGMLGVLRNIHMKRNS